MKKKMKKERKVLLRRVPHSQMLHLLPTVTRLSQIMDKRIMNNEHIDYYDSR
jgi:hypothetical protein